MKVFENSYEVTLNKNDFLASGGEGDIYLKNNKIYKIYQDKSKVIKEGKIKELNLIKNSDVIKPESIVLDNKGVSIGYSMRPVFNTYTLCQLFTKAFRNRNNVSHETVRDLILEFKNMIQDIHAADVLVVDMNELNFLISNDLKKIFAIDVDSYQTKSFHATAIMDSIRDRHSKSFSKETDWFSFGILTFQMFIGIHPYKGKHDTYKNIDERMQKNISVLNNSVSIPPVCYGFDVIPESFLQWYKAIFENGKRLPPPDTFDAIRLAINVHSITSTHSFNIDLIKEYDYNIDDVFFRASIRVIANNRVYLNNSKYLDFNHRPHLFFAKNGTPIVATLDKKIKLYNADTREQLNSEIEADNIFTYNHDLYAKVNDCIMKITPVFVGKNVIVSSSKVASIMPLASRIFDGCLIQNILGACYVSIFDGDCHYQIHLKEITGQVLDAKYSRSVLMIYTSDKDGKYHRHIMRFSDDMKSYDLRVLDCQILTSLNFTVLDSGLCVAINEDSSVEIFSSKKDSTNVKVINDSSFDSDVTLFNDGAKVLFAKEKKLYSISIKAP